MKISAHQLVEKLMSAGFDIETEREVISEDFVDGRVVNRPGDWEKVSLRICNKNAMEALVEQINILNEA